MVKEQILNLLELEKLAHDFSKRIEIQDIILLKGGLGSGKTTLTRLLIRNIFLLNKIDPPQIIPSPSFPILQSYPLKNFMIHHYDFYRIHHINEIVEIGFEESLRGNISIIEWPEIILPKISKYKSIIIRNTI